MILKIKSTSATPNFNNQRKPKEDKRFDQHLANILFGQCKKCIYETTCSKPYKYLSQESCPKYKRDPPDGGFYG